MAEKKTNIALRDRVTAAVLALVVLVAGFLSLSEGTYWGDDYAAYISEGIAIAEGRLDEQAELNTQMHPSPLPDEAVGQPLVYVWGYPLLLSAVYRAVGFDRDDFHTLNFYKLPSVLAFALLAAVLFLFLRRRVGYRLSLLMTAVFCSCSEFYTFINTMYSDMVFLFFALLALYVSELYLDGETKRRRLFTGVLLGAVLWYMYEVRLNGIAILLACAAAHGISLLRKHNRFSVSDLLPYAVFFLLKLISETIIAAPTANSSDVGKVTAALFLSNLKTYALLFISWFERLWNSLLINPLYSVLRRVADVEFADLGVLRSVCVWLSLGFAVIGMAVQGFKEDLHLFLLLPVYIAAACLLPYTQGLRYVYPLLPVLLMFCAVGLATLPKIQAVPSLWRTVITVALCAVCFYSVFSSASPALEEAEVVNVEDIYMQNAYSPDAVEVYRFIRTEIPEDHTLAFFAPRALYLNTGRFTIRPDANGHSIDEADEYLDYRRTGAFDLAPKLAGFSPIYENDEFILYTREKYSDE